MWCLGALSARHGVADEQEVDPEDELGGTKTTPADLAGEQHKQETVR